MLFIDTQRKLWLNTETSVNQLMGPLLAPKILGIWRKQNFSLYYHLLLIFVNKYCVGWTSVHTCAHIKYLLYLVQNTKQQEMLPFKVGTWSTRKVQPATYSKLGISIELPRSLRHTDFSNTWRGNLFIEELCSKLLMMLFVIMFPR